MEYFYEFQSWLYETRLYQEILKELPVPLNNIYFDSLIILGLLVYLLYRILDALWYALRRRRIRKQQEKERKLQLQREKEMMYRELKVQQKEESVGRFLDFMEMLVARRMEHTQGYGDRNITGQHGKRIGRKNFLLEKNGVPDTSDYDVVMDAVIYDVEQDSEITRKQKREQEQMQSRISELDEVLKVRVLDETEVMESAAPDAALEKRKERARRRDEKERQRAERKKRKEEQGWRIFKKKQT